MNSSDLLSLSHILCFSQKFSQLLRSSTLFHKMFHSIPTGCQTKNTDEAHGEAENSVNMPLVVRKMENLWEILHEYVSILTLERMSAWQASGQAYRAPPTLVAVWSPVERVFLNQGTHTSHPLLKTHTSCTCAEYKGGKVQQQSY